MTAHDRAFVRPKHFSRFVLSITALLIGLEAFLPKDASAYTIYMTVHLEQPLSDDTALVFDWIDGGAPSNSTHVFDLSSDGSLQTETVYGDATLGSVAGEANLSDGDFLNEYIATFSGPISWLSFGVNVGDLLPESDSFPDALSVFLMDRELTSFLISTNEPFGTNALLYADSSGFFSSYGFEGGTVDVSSSPNPSPVPVPEPATALLITVGLTSMLMRTKRRQGSNLVMVALLALTLFSPQAEAEDVTASTVINKSGFVLNRITNTYNSKVEVKNIGTSPLNAPVKLIVFISSAQASLKNGSGVMPDGKSFIELSLPSGKLDPNQVVSANLQFSNPSREKFSVTFAVDAPPAEPTGLPPDPGTGGDATLLGVDINNNGVRDDVERYIALTYPNSAKTRLILTYLTKDFQEVLKLPVNSRADSLALRDQLHTTLDCMYYLFKDEARNKLSDIKNRVFNTFDRIKAYAQYDRQLAGEVSQIPRDPSSSCPAEILD